MKKGEKAISLFMPVSVKRRADKDALADSAEAVEGGTFSMFMLRPNWFSLNQTEGDEFAVESVTPCVGCRHRYGRARHHRRTLRAPAGQSPGLCPCALHRAQPDEPAEAQDPVS